MKRLHLRSRLALLTAIAVAIAVAACALASWFLVKGELYEKLDDRLVALSTGPKDGRFTYTLEWSLSRCRTEVPTREIDWGPVVYQQVYRDDGQACSVQTDKGHTTTIRASDEVQQVLNGSKKDVFFNATASDGTAVRVVTCGVKGDFTVSTAIPLEEVEGPLTKLALWLLAVSAVGILGAAVAGLFTARASLKPVDRLTDAVEDIARTEDLSVRISAEGTDEIARLGRSFNQMTAALEASQERQRTLIADADHELRTPLTSMRTNIDLLIRSQQTGRDLPPETKAKLLASVKAQMQELTTLIGDLLQLGSPAARPRQVTEVPLHEVAERAVERARLRGPGLTVIAKLDPWYVEGDPDTLERAVVNLCDNAVKFSPPEGTVEVTLKNGELTVQDEGPGIPAEELPYVFDRFWRSPSARSLPGSGLGLAIVKQIAEESHGTIALEPVPGGGTLARLSLPGIASP